MASNYGQNYYSNYAGGDYYLGDYYQAGSIWSTITGGISKLGKVAAGAVGGLLSGGPAGAITGAAKALVKSSPGTSLVPLPPTFQSPIPVPKGTPGAQPVPGIKGTVERVLPGGKSGYQSPSGAPAGYHLNKSYSYAMGLPPGSYWVRNRAMNPGNARSLRRAIRRQQAFVSLARRVLRGTGLAVKRSGTPSGGKHRRKR